MSYILQFGESFKHRRAPAPFPVPALMRRGPPLSSLRLGLCVFKPEAEWLFVCFPVATAVTCSASVRFTVGSAVPVHPSRTGRSFMSWRLSQWSYWPFWGSPCFPSEHRCRETPEMPHQSQILAAGSVPGVCGVSEGVLPMVCCQHPSGGGASRLRQSCAAGLATLLPSHREDHSQRQARQDGVAAAVPRLCLRGAQSAARSVAVSGWHFQCSSHHPLRRPAVTAAERGRGDHAGHV